MIRLLMMLVVLSGVVQVQDLDLSGVNVQWLLLLVNDLVMLGVLIFGLVLMVKCDFECCVFLVVWNLWFWWGLVLGVGLVVSVLLYFVIGQVVLVLVGWLGVLVFGLVVGMVVIFGCDGLKIVLSWMVGVCLLMIVVIVLVVVLLILVSLDVFLFVLLFLCLVFELINFRVMVIVECGDDQVVFDIGY